MTRRLSILCAVVLGAGYGSSSSSNAASTTSGQTAPRNASRWLKTGFRDGNPAACDPFPMKGLA